MAQTAARFHVFEALSWGFARLSRDNTLRCRLKTFFALEGQVQRFFQEVLRQSAYVRKKKPEPGFCEHYTICHRFGLSQKADESIPGIHWDARNGLILRYDGRAIAVIGFQAVKDAIVVLQIQGVAGSEQELNKILWRQLLIRFLFGIAVLGGCRTVRIIQASESDYFYQIKYAPDTSHVTSEQETRRADRLTAYFDGTAKAMGFEFDGRYWNYYLHR